MAAHLLRQTSRLNCSDYFSSDPNGHGAMYSYADRVSPADRWAVIAYIRALQLSQNADAASLPDTDRTRLEAAK